MVLELENYILLIFWANSFNSDTKTGGLCRPPIVQTGGNKVDLEELILHEISEPTIPDRQFVITEFGAVPDGTTDCTVAFEKAINVVSNVGGGRITVPAGEYLTGAIHMKSNIELHLERGAIIKFIQDPNKYLPVILTRFEGMELYNYSPLIYAFNQRNFAITGEGILDGQSDDQHW